MRNREQAEILLRKAREDEFTADKLIPDPAAPDVVIGFHAQQAVEKMLKAILTLNGIGYPRIHDLTELVNILRENQIEFPQQ